MTTAHTVLGSLSNPPGSSHLCSHVEALPHWKSTFLCLTNCWFYLKPSSMTILSDVFHVNLAIPTPTAPISKTYVTPLAIMLDCPGATPPQNVIFCGPGQTGSTVIQQRFISLYERQGMGPNSHKDSRMNEEREVPGLLEPTVNRHDGY